MIGERSAETRAGPGLIVKFFDKPDQSIKKDEMDIFFENEDLKARKTTGVDRVSMDCQKMRGNV